MYIQNDSNLHVQLQIFLLQNGVSASLDSWASEKNQFDTVFPCPSKRYISDMKYKFRVKVANNEYPFLGQTFPAKFGTSS